MFLLSGSNVCIVAAALHHLHSMTKVQKVAIWFAAIWIVPFFMSCNDVKWLFNISFIFCYIVALNCQPDSTLVWMVLWCWLIGRQKMICPDEPVLFLFSSNPGFWTDKWFTSWPPSTHPLNWSVVYFLKIYVLMIAAHTGIKFRLIFPHNTLLDHKTVRHQNRFYCFDFFTIRLSSCADFCPFSIHLLQGMVF